MNKSVFMIVGMHCGACSARVQKKVSALEGILQAEVSLPAESLNIQYNPAKLNPNQVIEAVRSLGFDASLIEDQAGEEVSGSPASFLFRIEGMHCGGCSARVQNALQGIEGVDDAQVSLPAYSVRVKLKTGVDEQALVSQIIEAIAKLGFKASQKTELNTSNQSAQGGTVKNSIERWQEQQEKNSRQLAHMWGLLWPAFISATLLLLFSMGSMFLAQIGISLPQMISPDHSPLTFSLIQAALCLPAIWASRDIFKSGVRGARYLAPNMNTLVAMGSGAALFYSLWNSIEIGRGYSHLAHDLYFESAAVLLSLILLGRYFEFKSRIRAGEAIYKLIDLTPEKAVLLREDGEQVEVETQTLIVGDKLLIRPGARVPVDGKVLEGESQVDESLLTGESFPKDKNVGDGLTGGSINGSGALIIQAERVGQDTVLARIIKLVGEAQGSKAPIAALADQISLYFVPVVFVLAVASGLLWYFVGGMDFSFCLRISIAVLVVACPCAMGLATPISIMVGTGRGAQKGILVRNGAALQAAAGIDTLLMDKTGTLTLSKPILSTIKVLPSGEQLFEKYKLKGEDARNLSLTLAASVENWSEHSLGRAVHKAALEKGLKVFASEGFAYTTGAGVEANVRMPENNDILKVAVGSVKFALAQVSESSREQLQSATQELNGQTLLVVLVNNIAVAQLGLTIPARPESADVISGLNSMGITPVMLTGDSPESAKKMAESLGIKKVISQVLPEEKAKVVQDLVNKGHVVGMVGDGVNDAPALALAHVGIAMGEGTDVAVEAGDIVLMRDGLSGVLDALKLSRAVMRNIKQNLVWAFGYNILCIPVAAGLLYVVGGPTLSPMLAGLVMALSSVSVVLNALRLRKA